MLLNCSGLLLEISCPDVAPLPHMSVHIMDTEVDYVIFLISEAGFIFPDGRTFTSIFCTQSGKWSHDIEQYQRKL